MYIMILYTLCYTTLYLYICILREAWRERWAFRPVDLYRPGLWPREHFFGVTAFVWEGLAWKMIFLTGILWNNKGKWELILSQRTILYIIRYPYCKQYEVEKKSRYFCALYIYVLHMHFQSEINVIWLIS